MSEKIMKCTFAAAAGFSVAAVCVICFFLLYKGLPFIMEQGLSDFIGGKVWKPTEGEFGIFPMILGSIYMTAGAVLIGVPAALLTAVFMTCFCPGWLYHAFRTAVELLAGIPSIIYGFFGLMVIVPFLRDTAGLGGKSILAGSLILSIMILPTVTAVAESSLKAVPEGYYQGARALGATHERSVFRTVLPAAKPGLLAGTVLGIGRAAGETMAVVMVSGNQTAIPDSLLSGARTLTANIVLEMGYAGEGLHRDALIATAVVLTLFILIINISLTLLRKGSQI